MTTYRLPDALGGAKVEIVPNPSAVHPPMSSHVRVLVETDDESFPIDVPRSALVEVEPPPPPEPPVFSVVVVESAYAMPIAFCRYPEGWAETTSVAYCDWAKVCSYGTPTRYVPNPFAEPVELPWVVHSPAGTRLLVKTEGGNVVVHIGGSALIPPQGARALARALWAAADAAEATP